MKKTFRSLKWKSKYIRIVNRYKDERQNNQEKKENQRKSMVDWPHTQKQKKQDTYEKEEKKQQKKESEVN